MEAKYIVAISALGVFAFLFLIFFVLLSYRRRKEAQLQAYIHEVYSKKMVQFDYDAVDENAPPIIEGRVSIADELAVARVVEPEATQLHMNEVFGKMEIEGIEEITGNYKP